MWSRETLIPGLYAGEWYNGKKSKKGFLANMEDFLVGVPRIRLIRVEEGKFENVILASPFAMAFELLKLFLYEVSKCKGNCPTDQTDEIFE